MSSAVESPDPITAGSGDRLGATVRAKFRPSRAVIDSVKVKPKAKPLTRKRTERLALQLALAYRIERAIEAGEVCSYGDVARRLGITQPRVTQVMGLLLLSPVIQEQVLLGDTGLGIRAAMRAARNVAWAEQPAETSQGGSDGRGSRTDEPGAADQRGEAAAGGRACAPGQQRARALLASPSALGTPTGED